MTEYEFMAILIYNSITTSDLKAVEKSLDSSFDAGVFSISEFESLGDRILKRVFELEESLGEDEL